jgi:TIR domain
VRVFLSYRRSDVGGYAGRLADYLRERLGERSVFQDVSAIPLGEAFTAAIDRALDACDAVLAVIGPGWLTASTPDARPRLFDPNDYVRLELARAGARGAGCPGPCWRRRVARCRGPARRPARPGHTAGHGVARRVLAPGRGQPRAVAARRTRGTTPNRSRTDGHRTDHRINQSGSPGAAPNATVLNEALQDQLSWRAPPRA